jgi:hypothetical protein
MGGSGASGREARRPVIIDLPAEEIRGPSDAEAPAAEIESGAFAGGATDSTGPDATAAEPGSGDALGHDETVTPSAFATDTHAHQDPVPPAETIRQRRGTSFPALLAAAILGGLIGVGALTALDRMGYLDAFRGEDAGAAAVSAELASLRSEVEALRQSAGEQAGVDVAPLQQQVAGLEQAIAELRSQPAAGGDPASLGEVQNRLAALEQAASAAGSSEPSQALEARLGELASQVESLRSSGGTGATEPALAGIAKRIDEIAGRLGSLEGQGPVDISAVEASVSELQNRLDQLGERVEAAPTEERVAALETTLNDMTQRLNTTAAELETAAALGPAVAANALGAALEAGAPFTSELQALRGLGLDETALAGLAPSAETGLPTLNELRSGFEDAVATIDLRTPIPEGTGTLERLVQSARGLVEVRPAHPTEGSAPGAVVARIRGALSSGDLKTALAEWNSLPEEAKANTADWARAAEARLAADELVTRLRSEALSRLGREG